MSVFKHMRTHYASYVLAVRIQIQFTRQHAPPRSIPIIHVTGRFFVAEKMGLVKTIVGNIGVPQDIVLDISPQLHTFGDHGLTSIHWRKTPTLAPACSVWPF